MRQCAICEKGSLMGGERTKLRGKYNPTNWRRKQANLQYAKLPGGRALVCTKCIRTMAKNSK